MSPSSRIAARQFGGQDRDDGRPHHDAERIGADDVTGLGLGDAEAAGHVGQQPHGGEFAGADGEAADREGEFDQRRLAPLLARLGRSQVGTVDRGVRHGDLRYCWRRWRSARSAEGGREGLCASRCASYCTAARGSAAPAVRMAAQRPARSSRAFLAPLWISRGSTTRPTSTAPRYRSPRPQPAVIRSRLLPFRESESMQNKTGTCGGSPARRERLPGESRCRVDEAERCRTIVHSATLPACATSWPASRRTGPAHPPAARGRPAPGQPRRRRPAARRRPGGGLRRGALHEVVAPAGAGRRRGRGLRPRGRGPLRRPGAPGLDRRGSARAETGAPYRPGLAAHGLDPDRLILVRTARAQATLWAPEEALRLGAPAVLAELWGAKHYGLAPSRRLLLAAQAGAAPPCCSTRASRAAAPACRAPPRRGSRSRPAPSPAARLGGQPLPIPGAAGLRGAAPQAAPRRRRRFDRDRSHPLVWNPEQRCFDDHPLPVGVPAPAADRPAPARRAVCRPRRGRLAPDEPLVDGRQGQGRPAPRGGRCRRGGARPPARHGAGRRARDLPDRAVAEADPDADAALWRPSPTGAAASRRSSAPDGPDGVVLDIAGAAHLFGGEAGLIEAAGRARGARVSRPARRSRRRPKPPGRWRASAPSDRPAPLEPGFEPLAGRPAARGPAARPRDRGGPGPGGPAPDRRPPGAAARAARGPVRRRSSPGSTR